MHTPVWLCALVVLLTRSVVVVVALQVCTGVDVPSLEIHEYCFRHTLLEDASTTFTVVPNYPEGTQKVEYSMTRESLGTIQYQKANTTEFVPMVANKYVSATSGPTINLRYTPRDNYFNDGSFGDMDFVILQVVRLPLPTQVVMIYFDVENKLDPVTVTLSDAVDWYSEVTDELGTNVLQELQLSNVDSDARRVNLLLNTDGLDFLVPYIVEYIGNDGNSCRALDSTQMLCTNGAFNATDVPSKLQAFVNQMSLDGVSDGILSSTTRKIAVEVRSEGGVTVEDSVYTVVTFQSRAMGTFRAMFWLGIVMHIVFFGVCGFQCCGACTCMLVIGKDRDSRHRSSLSSFSLDEDSQESRKSKSSAGGEPANHKTQPANKKTPQQQREAEMVEMAMEDSLEVKPQLYPNGQ